MSSLSLGGFELRLRWGLTLLAAAGIALAAALGNWQLDRARYKEALQQRHDERGRGPPVSVGVEAVDPREIVFRRVEVRGSFSAEHAVFIDNQVHRKVPGYHVLMPLRIAGSEKHVLVNRGWIAAERDRARTPAVKTPQGEIVVRGIATVPSERFLELSGAVAEGNVWQNLVLERYREAMRLDIHPIVVQQDAGQDDGLAREWLPPDFGRNTHLAYAFQWYVLGVTILIYYLVTNVRRKPQAGEPS